MPPPPPHFQVITRPCAPCQPRPSHACHATMYALTNDYTPSHANPIQVNPIQFSPYQFSSVHVKSRHANAMQSSMISIMPSATTQPVSKPFNAGQPNPLEVTPNHTAIEVNSSQANSIRTTPIHFNARHLHTMPDHRIALPVHCMPCHALTLQCMILTFQCSPFLLVRCMTVPSHAIACFSVYSLAHSYMHD